VTSAAELRAALEGGAAPGETIFIADGTYAVEPMAINVPDIVIRSLSGDRESVVLDGNYAENAFGNGSILNVWASGVTIAHLTLMRAYHHPVHVTGMESGHTERTLLYDLHIVDGREQQIKANAAGDGARRPLAGRVACSLIELTEAGRAEVADYGGYASCYTGGFDGHYAFDWVIEHNVFRGIYCGGREVNVAEHGVHLWSTGGNNLVQNNVFVDCSRGVGIGMGESTQPGTVVRNNLFFASPGFTDFDTGIELEGAADVEVVHNTMVGPLVLGVNQRRQSDTGRIANNIVVGTSHPIRGSSGCTVSHNHVLDDAAIFASVDPANPGFLRLGALAGAQVVDAGLDLRQVCPEDIDGEARDAQPDLGADERGEP
jgi:hypothetical protein